MKFLLTMKMQLKKIPKAFHITENIRTIFKQQNAAIQGNQKTVKLEIQEIKTPPVAMIRQQNRHLATMKRENCLI